MKIKNCLQAVSSCFKLFSIGKYNTPFYFNKSDSFSTVFSGIVTFFCVGILISYAIFVMSAIFNRDHMNFDVTADSLEFSMKNVVDDNYTSVCLGKNDCLQFTLLDLINGLASNLKFDITIKGNSSYDCTSAAIVTIQSYTLLI